MSHVTRKKTIYELYDYEQLSNESKIFTSYIQFNLVLGNPEFSHDGSVVNEIKIAEIVEMRSEVAEENNFCCLLQEGEFR